MVKHSERFKFERFLSEWSGIDLYAIREARSEYGYEDVKFDMAWAAWLFRASANDTGAQ